MGVLQNGLGRGFARSVSALRVHSDQERLLLVRTAAHSVLQGGAVFERVEGNNAVVVVRRQQQDGGERGTGVRGLRQVMERRIPGQREGQIELMPLWF